MGKDTDFGEIWVMIVDPRRCNAVYLRELVFLGVPHQRWHFPGSQEVPGSNPGIPTKPY
jgi:hypothetical protein